MVQEQERAKSCDTCGLQSCSKARLWSTSCYKNKIKQWRQLCSHSTHKKEKPLKQPRRTVWWSWTSRTTPGSHYRRKLFISWPMGQRPSKRPFHIPFSLQPHSLFHLTYEQTFARQGATSAFWAPLFALLFSAYNGLFYIERDSSA